jgi:hypothetical protein
VFPNTINSPLLEETKEVQKTKEVVKEEKNDGE